MLPGEDLPLRDAQVPQIRCTEAHLLVLRVQRVGRAGRQLPRLRAQRRVLGDQPASDRAASSGPHHVLCQHVQSTRLKQRQLLSIRDQEPSRHRLEPVPE